MEKSKDLGKTVKTVSKLGDSLNTAGKMLLSTFLGTHLGGREERLRRDDKRGSRGFKFLGLFLFVAKNTQKFTIKRNVFILT